MKRFFKLLSVLVALNICLSAFAQSTQTSIRLYHSYLPFQGMLESGEGDRLSTKILVKILNDVNIPFTAHYIINARLQRTVLSSVEPACALFQVKNPLREAHLYFSQALAVGLNNQLYIVRGALDIPAQHFDENGAVRSLEALMESFPEERLMILDRRSYGEKIDKQITKISNQQLIRASINKEQRVSGRLLSRGRANLAIMLPSEAEEMSASEEYTQLEAYKISGMDGPLFAHISCNMKPESRTFIHRINSIMDALYTNPIFTQMHLDEYPEQHHPFLIEEISKLSKVTP